MDVENERPAYRLVIICANLSGIYRYINLLLVVKLSKTEVTYCYLRLISSFFLVVFRSWQLLQRIFITCLRIHRGKYE